MQAPAPKNVAQLRSFLGLLNCYDKFLPNLSSTLAPLYDLLKNSNHWCWNSLQQSAFQKAKNLLTSSSFLVHFDPDKEVVLACDSSEYSLGAVCLTVLRMDLTVQLLMLLEPWLLERKYSQLDKEALAIVFGVDMFHQYLYGKHFTILSDHKPLQYLFNEERPVPPMASSWVQCWALTLSAYSYSIVFRPGKLQGNADALSHLPLPVSPSEVPIPGNTVLLLEALGLSESLYLLPLSRV